MRSHDPFVFESMERIISAETSSSAIASPGKKEVTLQFTDTIFYPGGGGQPQDRGTIFINGEEYKFKEVYKKNDSVYHVVEVPPGMEIIPGMAVELKIDAERRQRLIKMHTGEHLFMGSLLKIIPGLKVEKIRLEEEESSLFVIPPEKKEIAWVDIFKAEEITNKIIKEDRKVSIHVVDKNDAQKRFPKARIKIDRITQDSVRIIEIEEHDYSACAGVHCTKTSFIGNFLVTKFNKNQDKYEIRFKVDDDRMLYEMSRHAREAASELRTSTEELPGFCRDLLKEKEDLKEKVRNFMSGKKLEVEEETSGNIIIKHAEVEDFDKKQITDKLNEIYDEDRTDGGPEGKKIAVLFNITPKGIQFNMKISPDLGDVSEIIKNTEMKGGGKGQFASGKCQEKSVFIKNLKTYLNKPG